MVVSLERVGLGPGGAAGVQRTWLSRESLAHRALRGGGAADHPQTAPRAAAPSYWRVGSGAGGRGTFASHQQGQREAALPQQSRD